MQIQPHNRAGGQSASQVCQCHDTQMYCVRVVSLVKTLGLSPLRSFRVWALTHVNTGMKGMLDEGGTQRARRISVCAVRAMHVPNLGIHTSWRFPCALIHPFFLFTGLKGNCLLLPAPP